MERGKILERCYRGGATAVRLVAWLPARFGSRGTSERWRERLGLWPGDGTSARGGALWVHAASVGETAVAGTLIRALRGACPGVPVLLTCNTATARALAREQALAEEVRFFPIDHPRIVGRVLKLRRPRAFYFVETEIWPSLLLELHSRAVPAAMVNARISERSFRRYRLVRALLARALGTLTAVCARDEASCQRLLALGAPPERTFCTGDLKLDGLLQRARLEPRPRLPLAAGERPAIVAASTHRGEDEVLLEAYGLARRGGADFSLVLAPRHPRRAGEVVKAARGGGWRVCLRSQARCSQQWDVLVVDTVGELFDLMREAAGVFVGGSLVPVGGHNLMEPAVLSRPVVAGPRLENVREQAAALGSALAVAAGARELAAVWSRWIQHPEEAAAQGRQARTAAEAAGGALERTMDVLKRHGLA